MKCHNCEKEFNDKDGMMYLERSIEGAGALGSRFVWLCNNCIPLFDYFTRDKIWSKVHGIKMSKKVVRPKLDRFKYPKLKYNPYTGKKLNVFKRIKNMFYIKKPFI